MSSANLLEICHLTKSFNDVQVLKDVSFFLKKGEIVGLIGENGAGKSTLAKCITGIHKPDSGEISLNGSCYSIPQEFNLIPVLSVYENIFLGREVSSYGLLQKKFMIQKSKELLSQIHCEIDPCTLVKSLGVAEKQKVEIAKQFLKKSNLLIMDEPTTVLNRNEASLLFGIMREFSSGGGGIIYISHKLEEVREICNRIVVLRDGVLVAQRVPSEVSGKQLAELMVGRELSQIYPPKQKVEKNAADVLSVENLSSGKEVQNVSFSIKRGEILGLAGLAGAGRTELQETICGLRKKNGGTVRLFGKEVQFKNPAEQINAGISYLSEDRQGTAVLTDFTISENTTLSSLKNYCFLGFIHKKKCKESTLKYAEQFDIKMNSVEDRVLNLSGGNQQKVAIAKGLDVLPVIFIFDEPTRGVDVGARSDIYRFIHDLAQKGISCIMISSDLEEVIGNCDRVLVMREGHLAGEVKGDMVTENEIMYLATGVKNETGVK